MYIMKNKGGKNNDVNYGIGHDRYVYILLDKRIAIRDINAININVPIDLRASSPFIFLVNKTTPIMTNGQYTIYEENYEAPHLGERTKDD